MNLNYCTFLELLPLSKFPTQDGRYRGNQSVKKDHPDEAGLKGRASPIKQLHQNKSPNKEGSGLQGSNSLTSKSPRKQLLDKAIPAG